MEPARGDSRPCTCAGCTGTMQYGRESDNHVAPALGVKSSLLSPDPKGWICSKDPDHFRQTA